MVEIYSVFGEWKLNDKLHWRFFIDTNKGGSLCEVAENITYKDLVETVFEDFELDGLVKEITLSYELPRMKLMVEDSPPIFIRNDRQVCTFIKKIQGNLEITRLCVSEFHQSFGSDISLSTPRSDTCSTAEKEKTSNSFVLPAARDPILILTESSHPTVNETHKELDRYIGSDISTTHNDIEISTAVKGKGFYSEHLVPALDLIPISMVSSHSTRGADDIYVNRYFKNKEELMLKMRKWALEWKFEFRSLWSNKTRVILGCVHDKCSWKMRATRVLSSEFFVVKKYCHEHSCDTTHRNANHRQATAKLLGSFYCNNYGEKKVGLKPKQIMELVRKDHGVYIPYKKAWRAKEEGQNFVRNTAEDSHLSLAKWLYMAREKNPGTVSYLELDLVGEFKYVFIAFGQSIRGFSLMRRVIAVDGTFLKGKYKGTLLAASAQDGDFHLYPIAFAIVDSENDIAWNWFFRCLLSIIPDAPDLVFVSDRAQSIEKAISELYPASHHGICRFHLLNNIKVKFRSKSFLPLFEAAANAYTFQEFEVLFRDIHNSNPKLAKYLEDADFKKWARCYAPSNRYNIMTTNIAESLNSMLKDLRELPVISLLETIRTILTTWFHERREKASKHNKHATPNVTKEIVLRFNDAMKQDVFQVDQHEFEVKDDKNKFVVHLKNKTCTCCVFDIDRIPCIHAIAAAKRTNMDEYKLVDHFYLTDIWAKAYAESIHPSGDVKSWVFPDSLDVFFCAPPQTRIKSGRPPEKRKRSIGEFGVPGSKSQRYKCGRCGREGHNKSTCRFSI
ncbi:PREDICTED: uncharacterized protein LOC104757102 [Camelina sativa]|uniref:Uncharacterized protein LOC104757102 n=1 Tax=Camelina sativa TaxID=90675 RepID=A0ABM1R7X3_CAMSA|nr:PREDICTED: uncharacterized protein LOC104757102 [Camelina sativa]XP_019095111.1 PREDICTED: uncharacterized protein LOC104757102 [Camelina sativa]